jgi:hypothetical protein
MLQQGGNQAMAKFYVQSGRVRLVLSAGGPREAAIKAFQWTCDKQATIQATTCVEHLLEAERRGWQLEEEITVSEQGFSSCGGETFETLEIVAAWQQTPQLPSPTA